MRSTQSIPNNISLIFKKQINQLYETKMKNKIRKKQVCGKFDVHLGK
jgi:hypothetical protein